MSRIIYEIKDLTKRFPGVVALDSVSFSLREGEVHALVGENGAGKSTLMNVMSGAYIPEEGALLFDEKPVKFKSPRDAQDIGIGMIHQELSLSLNLPVWENIFQGRLLKDKLGIIRVKEMIQKSIETLSRLGIANIDPCELVRELSVSQMQLVEICKAILLNAKVLIMDEPTSSLTQKEVKILMEIIRGLREKGIAIVYISHKLEEIMEIADRITVFRDGRHIETLPKEEVTIEKMVSLMVGREFDKNVSREFLDDYDSREKVLEVKNLNYSHMIKDANISLYKGEILGLAGLVGARRSELLESIFGFRRIASGEIYVEGKKRRIRRVKDAIELGIGLVPEGRKTQGLFLKLDVEQNMTIVKLKELKNALKLLVKKEEDAIAGEYVGKLAIKTPSLDQLIENLSGGNQQKTIIARWLMNSPRILFLDEPTQGIDVGAKSEIYRIINELSAAGVSIILVSSEMTELLALCDRIVVMCEGKITASLLNKEADQETIMTYATQFM